MFSQGHLVWAAISACVIAAGLCICLKKKPKLKELLRIALIIGIISEIIKFFSVAEMVPMVNPAVVDSGGNLSVEYVPTGQYTPYVPLEHIPFELCSLFIVFLILALFVKDGPWKRGLYALMFAAGTIGAAIAIILPSITIYLKTPSDYFTRPLVYQFFIYHSVIVVVCIYIGGSKEAGLCSNDWKAAINGLILLDLPTYYLNSVFSSEIYYNDAVVGVTHRINFFSSYVNPLGLVLTEKWQWMVYLLIRLIIAVDLVIGLFHTPLLNRNRHQKVGS